MISDHLTRLSYFFPWGLVVALVLAVIFGTIGVLIFRSATKKRDVEPAKAKPHHLLTKCRLFFARFGYFSSDSLSKSFDSALKLMHAFIGGNRFRYQLPWIVMLGTSDSGKSSILQSLDLDRPVGRPHFETEGSDKPPCDWWFYDHGIVLDLAGNIVLEASQTISNEDQWDLFLNLLVHHRPKRPLDGIVLTIPATEVVGQSALSHDDIMLRAEYLYAKLWQMQRLTGLRIPVYITVTKCDQVPGFESFCKSIPGHNRRDIFGWSNDKAIDSTYTTEWIDEAFSSINDSLYRTQEEIFADAKTIDGRDGVFMFPLAFNQLKGGIQTYADHLFKPSSYHESFFLRGIYFTGDSHIINSQPVTAVSFEPSFTVNEDAFTEKRNLYFVDNLFENKVFREVGLARPVSRALLGNTTLMRFAKIGVAIAAVLGTLGLLRANDKLQNAKLNLLPALTQVEVTLEKTRGQNDGTEIARVFFDNQAETLLNTMTQISVNHLSSFFIPASWFDNLDKKIGYVMGLAYDQVILRSMGSQLAYKAEQLVSLGTIIPVTEQVGNGIDPLETAEFYRLRNYVISIRALELAAEKFNDLGMTSSLKDVSDIIKYLFNYDMPESFFSHDSYYIDALKQTNVKIFDFDSYRDNASIKLRKLFDEFELAAFDPNQMIPGLGQLMTSLYEFSGARNYTAYDTDLLREVYVSLDKTIKSISNPGFQWLDADHFDPGPQYEYIMGLVVGSSFFMNSTASDLIREVDQNFINFRRRLATYASPLLKGASLFRSEDGLAFAEPSPGALGLRDNLKVFFNEAFMAPASVKTILTSIPIGSVLLWDTLRLQEAVNLIGVYNDFMNSRLLSMPKMLQPMLQKVGSESLIKNLVQFIADAEVFSSETAVASSFSPEDSLLTQVQNYRVSAPYLEQILFSLRANNANNAFSTLKALLLDQNYKPLQKLDSILAEESPYAIKMNSFDWWNGQNMASLEAFGVSNLSELKNYLELQRDRINYLAREFAEPLVSFLQEINKEGMPGNFPLVTKWDGIINELNGYDKKAAGNGLVELENYIMTPLNEVTLATCPKYASSTSMISASNDFFESILIDIQEKLMKQCGNLSGYVSADNYTQLYQFFNANLAGKFPFVEKADGTSPDASPDDIRTFFEMMDTQASGIKATLAQATDLGASGKNALTFIEQMEKVRSFFGGYLVKDSTISSPAFSFNVTFRVNESKESRGNEILDWKIEAKDAIISMRSTSKKGFWTAGDPINVTLHWAANSPLQPLVGGVSEGLDVQGANAVFSYNGTWALLRLLRQHQSTPTDFQGLTDEQPITLRFEVPLTNVVTNSNGPDDQPKAVVFVRLEVSPLAMTQSKEATSPSQSSTQPTDQSKIRVGQPVNLPYFPFQAPQLRAPVN
jgi:type VI secretion system protein ImpL